MKDLLQSLDELPLEWGGKNLVLFLDYDGTLAPIAATPEQALLPPENRAILKALAEVPGCQVVVISGRSLSDVKLMVGVDGIDYIGNHGWEIEGPYMRFDTMVPPQVAAAMEQVYYELAAKLSVIDGAFVENKGITLSVHYRLVDEAQAPLLRQIFDRVCVPYCKRHKIKVHLGKKVLEVRPAIEWDKGKAALWFLKKQQLVAGNAQVLSIYIGDDVTDEDAFTALKDKGPTVFVGGESQVSNAEYFLSDHTDVRSLLKHLLSSMTLRENTVR